MSNSSRGFDPDIKFVKESKLRIVLVIEDTASMNIQVHKESYMSSENEYFNIDIHRV